MDQLSVCSLCRQVKEKLFLKGVRCRTKKCALEGNYVSPGEHGRKFGGKRLSVYGKQLREKQKAKIIYGMREGQFKKFFSMAFKSEGATGEVLLSLLERRLDNVLFRLKMSFSRSQSRQLVVHGHVAVNDKVVSAPSFIVNINDKISFSQSGLKSTGIKEGIADKRLGMGVRVPDWLELKKEDREGVVLRLPARSDVTLPIEEHLIVELYSK